MPIGVSARRDHVGFKAVRRDGPGSLGVWIGKADPPQPTVSGGWPLARSHDAGLTGAIMGSAPYEPPMHRAAARLRGRGLGRAEGFNGRWIIEPLGDNNGRVLWLEVSGAGTDSISGFMVGGGPGGQLDPIHEAKIERGQLSFHLERRFGPDRNRLVKTPVIAALQGDLLHGAAQRERGPLLWLGRRAPVLPERDDGSWREGQPIALLDGSGINGWRTLRPGREEGWFTEGGVLKNHRRADVLVSDAVFWNFRMQAEYLVHPGMNGGIGLRGRYEIQILDDHGKPASDHGNASLYGRIAPSVNASLPARQWQTLDVRLVGRELTLVLNGVKTIDRATINGFTAMATDWREDKAGPITLQGDHGAVEFRKIVITPLAQ